MAVHGVELASALEVVTAWSVRASEESGSVSTMLEALRLAARAAHGALLRAEPVDLGPLLVAVGRASAAVERQETALVVIEAALLDLGLVVGTAGPGQEA